MWYSMIAEQDERGILAKLPLSTEFYMLFYGNATKDPDGVPSELTWAPLRISTMLILQSGVKTAVIMFSK